MAFMHSSCACCGQSHSVVWRHNIDATVVFWGCMSDVRNATVTTASASGESLQVESHHIVLLRPRLHKRTMMRCSRNNTELPSPNCKMVVPRLLVLLRHGCHQLSLCSFELCHGADTAGVCDVAAYAQAEALRGKCHSSRDARNAKATFARTLRKSQAGGRCTHVLLRHGYM